MATKYSEGLRIDHTPEADVDPGDVIVQNDLIGIATTNIAAGVLGTIDIEGVFAMDKAVGSNTAIELGTIVYWDEGNQVVTTTAYGNVYLGKTISNAEDDDEIVGVKLTP